MPLNKNPDDLDGKRLEQELTLYKRMVNASHDSITLIDRNYVYQVANNAYINARKMRGEEILHHSVAAVWGNEVFNELIKEKLDECFKGKIVSHESAYEFNKGELNYIETRYYPCLNSEGETVYAVIVSHNITELKKSQEKIKHLAYYDSLTNLPSRLLFMDRLHHAIEITKRDKKSMALFFLDLDEFKKINDTFGHSAGDELLVGVAKRLQKSLREIDTIGRLGEVISILHPLTPKHFSRIGGDEFTLIIPNLSDKKFSTTVAERVISLFKDPFQVAGREMFISTSIGVALYPDNGKDVETLLKNADTAMYSAKGQGKNTFQYYSSSMNIQALERINLENKLRYAIKNEEFLLYYQPQYDINTRQLVGVEALIRWKNLEMGLVPPGDFIPLAEETGMIIPIGEWVMRSACRQGKIWHDRGFGNLHICVNFSMRQFFDIHIVDKIKSIIETTQCNPHRLEIEITESAMMHDTDRAIHILNELQEMGMKISLDDFGTGYSSLTYLKKFPIDTLKIDQSFVRNADLKGYDGVIISAITEMCNQLRIKVVAEGVETEEILNFLKKRNCHVAQGFFFSRPLPVEEFEKLL